MSYKRNQIEEAIARISVSNYEKPPLELRTRIKRLLELDRSMGRKLGLRIQKRPTLDFSVRRQPVLELIFRSRNMTPSPC
jgi:hypothetical protein